MVFDVRQQPGQCVPHHDPVASAKQRRRYSRFVSWGKGGNDVNIALALEAWKQRDPAAIVQEAARQVERAILLDAASAKGSSAVRQEMFAKAGEMFELAISIAADDWRIIHMYANTLVAQALHLRHCANRAEKKFNNAYSSVDQRYRAEMSLGGDEGGDSEDELLDVAAAVAPAAAGTGGGRAESPSEESVGAISRHRGSSMLETTRTRYPIAELNMQYHALFTKAGELFERALACRSEPRPKPNVIYHSWGAMLTKMAEGGGSWAADELYAQANEKHVPPRTPLLECDRCVAAVMS